MPDEFHIMTDEFHFMSEPHTPIAEDAELKFLMNERSFSMMAGPSSS
jgi:hypothetical protein